MIIFIDYVLPTSTVRKLISYFQKLSNDRFAVGVDVGTYEYFSIKDVRDTGAIMVRLNLAPKSCMLTVLLT